MCPALPAPSRGYFEDLPRGDLLFGISLLGTDRGRAAGVL